MTEKRPKNIILVAAHTYIAHMREHPARERRKMMGRRGRKGRKKKTKWRTRKGRGAVGFRRRRRKEKVEGGG